MGLGRFFSGDKNSTELEVRIGVLSDGLYSGTITYKGFPFSNTSLTADNLKQMGVAVPKQTNVTVQAPSEEQESLEDAALRALAETDPDKDLDEQVELALPSYHQLLTERGFTQIPDPEKNIYFSESTGTYVSESNGMIKIASALFYQVASDKKDKLRASVAQVMAKDDQKHTVENGFKRDNWRSTPVFLYLAVSRNVGELEDEQLNNILKRELGYATHAMEAVTAGMTGVGATIQSVPYEKMDRIFQAYAKAHQKPAQPAPGKS